MSDVIQYSWDSLHSDALKIGSLVDDLNFVPDIIVGVTSGGIIASVILGEKFCITPTTIRIASRDTMHSEVDKVCIYAQHGSKVLLISETDNSVYEMFKSRSFDVKNNICYTSLWYDPSRNNYIHLWANVIDRSIDERYVKFPYRM